MIGLLRLQIAPRTIWLVSNSDPNAAGFCHQIGETFESGAYQDLFPERIPEGNLRELITEAEGCAKMNYLTGASACTRKAIYELLALQKAEGANYDDKIGDLRLRHPAIDSELFEIIGHIKDMTSDHVHEQSWIAWDSKHLQLFLETLKAVLHEIYVVPEEKRERASAVRVLREQLGKAKNVDAQSAQAQSSGDPKV
jgi:hypothetical protein